MLLPQRLDLTLAFKAIGLSESLTDSDKRVACALLDHFNTKTGRCDPAMGTIALLVGVSERTVIRSVDLVETGLFRRDRHGGKFKRNRYRPVWATFREAENAWCARKKIVRARYENAGMSPEDRHDCHVPTDKPVTQTSPINHSYKTSVESERSLAEAVSRCRGSGADERAMPARASQGQALSSIKASRDAARNRWDHALLRQFSADPGIYGRIVEAITQELSDAATAAELSRRGAGSRLIVEELINRGSLLPDKTISDDASSA